MSGTNRLGGTEKLTKIKIKNTHQKIVHSNEINITQRYNARDVLPPEDPFKQND